MSWLTDPFQLAAKPTIEEAEIDLEEPPSNEEIFFSSFRRYPDTVGRQQGIHTSICRFDDKGNHVVMSDNCPHFDSEDEQGRKVNPGWTVQSRT